MYNEVFIYFEKAIIVIYAKYLVTFRISYLLNILSEAEENFKLSSKKREWFMIGCFTVQVLQLRKIKKNHATLLQRFNFVAANTKKSLKCGYYL